MQYGSDSDDDCGGDSFYEWEEPQIPGDISLSVVVVVSSHRNQGNGLIAINIHTVGQPEKSSISSKK